MPNERSGPMRAAIYCRVSTADQNADMQRNELLSYCERRGWTVSEVYTDEGVSGSKESRPALNRLISAAKRRAFDAVVVWKFDRFARSMRQLVTALSEFDSLGIQFVSLHEQIDTTSPNGKLMFGIFAAFAEFERSLIIERTKSGIEAARKRGKHIGRPRVSVDAAAIRDLRAAGHSWDRIAVQTGIARSTAQRAVL
jgi:DNA invertase Pin-like site-specific DNA recombinase